MSSRQIENWIGSFIVWRAYQRENCFAQGNLCKTQGFGTNCLSLCSCDYRFFFVSMSWLILGWMSGWIFKKTMQKNNNDCHTSVICFLDFNNKKWYNFYHKITFRGWKLCNVIIAGLKILKTRYFAKSAEEDSMVCRSVAPVENWPRQTGNSALTAVPTEMRPYTQCLYGFPMQETRRQVWRQEKCMIMLHT